MSSELQSRNGLKPITKCPVPIFLSPRPPCFLLSNSLLLLLLRKLYNLQLQVPSERVILVYYLSMGCLDIFIPDRDITFPTLNISIMGPH